MAGYNNKYAACTLDSWPIVNFKYQLLLSFLSINFFEMVGDVQILGGHIQDVHSMVSFYYRMNEHSGYVKVTLGHLASGSPGLTHFTCTPEGYCYFAQRGLDEFAGNDNYTINVRHIATLSSFSFLIELPIKNRPFYVSSMINYPNDGGKIIVATSKVEPETREEEGKVEIYNVFREDTYYLWTKIFEKSMPSGYTFTPSIMAINDNKISFIVSYYKTYPIEDPIIRRTYLYELQIDTGTLTELSIFEHAVLDKCIYIGNGRYIAIANYIGETESEAPGIFISLDGGSTWQDAYRNMEFYFTDIEYIGYNSIIATASSSYGNPASVLFSFDGGLTWQEYKYLFWESQYPIENPNNICIHGNSKRIYMTTSFQSYQNDTIIYTQI